MSKKRSYRLCLEQLETREVPSTLAPAPTWTNHGVGGGGSLFGPSINPANGSDIYISSDMSGVFHSTTGGQSWQLVNFNQLQGYTYTQVQYTENSSILYALNANTQAPSVSSDGGQTWQTLANDPTGGGAFAVYASPTNHNIVLVSDYTHLYASTNGGSSFTTAYTTTDTSNGLYVAGAYFNGNTIYVGTSKGLLLSTDGGNTFSMTDYGGIASGQGFLSFTGATQNGVTRLFGITTSTGDLYPGIEGYDAYMTESVYSVTVGQGGWTLAQTGLASDAHPFFVSMAANNINSAYLAGATDGSAPGVYLTTNGGSSWSSVFLTGNNQNIQTAAAGSGGTLSWGFDELAMGFTVNSANANQAILTTYGFAYMTTNGGQTWQALNAVPSTLNAVNTATSTGAYTSSGLDDTTVWGINWATANNMIAASTDIHGAVSSNAGQSWSLLSSATGQPYNTLYNSVTQNGVTYGAVSSVHDIYQSTHLTASSIDGGSGAVLFSTNNGASWQVMHNFAHPVVWVATDPTNANRLYASVVNSTSGGIWVTNDAQDGASSTWTELAAPPRTQGHPLDIRVLNDGTLVVSYSGLRSSSGAFTATSGVFMSTNGGQSWTDVSAPGMDYWTQDVIISPNDPTQSTWYAAVYSGWGGPASGLGGLYMTTNRGQTWTQIFSADSVTSATISPTNSNLMYVTTENNGLWTTTNLQSGTPTFTQDSSFAFKEPLRVYFNPYNSSDIWVTSFGGGMFEYTAAAAAPTPPTATIAGPASGTAGQTLTFTLGASTSTSGTAAAVATTSSSTPYTYQVNWNDGSGVQSVSGASSLQVTHTFATAGAYTVSVTAAIGGTASAPATTTTAISTPVVPTATVTGPSSGSTSQALTFTLGASESNAAATATYTYTINWNDGSAAQTVTGGASVQVSHTFAAAGSYTVSVTTTDASGTVSSAATAAVSISSPVVVAPTATVAGPATATLGQFIAIIAGASESNLPASSSYTYTIHWGDGVTVIVSGATGMGVAHLYSSSGLYTVQVTATDPSGQVSTAVSTGITMSAAPVAATVGGPSKAVPGQPLTYTLNAGAPAGATYTYSLQWGDGSTDTVTGAGGLQVSHTYTGTGNFTVKETAKDGAGNSSSASATVKVIPGALEVDPLDPTKTAYYVGGTNGSDTITVTPANQNGGMQFTLNGATSAVQYPTGHIIIYGLGGNDNIQLTNKAINKQQVYLAVPAFVFGGSGSDTISASGSSANNVLEGGDGANNLSGGIGHDLMIGGSGGATSFAARGAGDIEIAGTTNFDNDLAALNAIMAEWSRTDIDYATKVAHLTGAQPGGLNGNTFLNANTVQADQSADYMYANYAALDLFFAQTSGSVLDQVYGQHGGDVVTSI